MKQRVITEKMIEMFQGHLRKEEKSRATQEKYVRDVRAFSAYAAGRDVTKELAAAYKKKLHSDGYAPSSINSMLASLNSLFSYAGWTDCRVKSIKFQRQIYCPEEKELTKEEYRQLVDAAKGQGKERLSLLLQTICSTGIRVTVFLVKALQKKLLWYVKKQKIKLGAIFVTRTGRPMSRVHIWRELKSLCQRAGVNPEKVFPHNLRHLFARTFYSQEKDIAKLADLLGHNSINTTRIYIVTSGTEHRRSMELMRLVC